MQKIKSKEHTKAKPSQTHLHLQLKIGAIDAHFIVHWCI